MSIARTLIANIRNKESDPINKARILMAFYLMIAYFFFGVILMAAYIYTNQTQQLFRASIITILASLFLLILYNFNSWRIISHFIMLMIMILGVWGNLLYYVRGVNTATLQYVWLVSALGFYMHGSKWGWFYTVFSIVPVLIASIYTYSDYYILNNAPDTVAKPIYIFVLVFGFFAIAFLHYFFFRAFNRNIQSLTDTKNQLNEINEKLNVKIGEVNELSNSRMSFLSTMSHELRTPLNGVIGLTNVLLLQDPRKDQEETLAVLKFSAENLFSLVNDVLDFNKLESEMVELERIPFSLSNFISNIYASAKLKAQEKQLTFNVEVDDALKGITLIGDPTRMTQILLNLINNAIKFTEKGGVKLVCSVSYLKEQYVKVKFLIEDTGIGIEKCQQELIFQEFVQASANTNRKFGGTGLGLPIVKKVLALHHSELEVESELGMGTRMSFEITFPFHEETVVKVNENLLRDIAAKDLKHLKILVVEDNAVNILVITKTLARIGITPDVAENGKLALEHLLQNDYDLILMDLYMPVMDGYEAAQKIRAFASPKKAKTPIIAITATVNNKVLDEVTAAGMNGYLSKPFHPNDLFEELRKYVV